ncbi:LOW QUALITY PROTEIN: ornithine carbamoyltransferase [Geomicrobium sp. JCM 19039]|nr:LOW QUALITY PROTEIN: ornithine carbamoyltransferase [Geomicrobium sp. JCM 19039]
MQQTKTNITGKDVLTWKDFTTEEIEQLLEQANLLKKKLKNNESQRNGRNHSMIFQNASTRTRVSFEVGMTQLGGHALFLSGEDLQIGVVSPLKITARAMSRYVDAIMIRANDHEMVQKLAEMSDVPVINALTDLYHPCQALADALTIQEQFGRLKGLNITYVGDGNNVAHSLMIIAAKLGMNMTMATPQGYEGDTDVWDAAQKQAEQTGATIRHVVDPEQAVSDAHIVYTDVWTSMGAEKEQQSRLKIFEKYQVNEPLMAKAQPGAIFMHCLPAHRGEEVSASVLEGKQSVVFDQAENRLHVQKAILTSVMEVPAT